MTCDLVRKMAALLPLGHSGGLGSRSLIRVQDRPCIRCVKRSIGHLCHDEPRESARSSKSEQSNTASDNEIAVKEEESLAYMLGPSVGQQQADQQMLPDPPTSLAGASGIPGTQMSPAQFISASSNSMTQGMTFGDKNQQCEAFAHHLVSITDENSFGIQ